MKIKSITDVITNSSSEVFIIRNGEMPTWSGASGSELKTWNCTIESFDEEQEALCEIMGWNCEDTGGTYVDSPYGGYWDWMTMPNVSGDYRCEQWDEWVNSHIREVTEKIKNLSWVEIGDHYYEDAWESDTAKAHNVCIYSDSRH